MIDSSSRIDRMRQALALLAPTQLTITDDSHRHVGHEGARDGRGHFSIDIISPAFDGKASLARHRQIYEALGALMQTDIHAVSIKARTPGEAVSANAKGS